MAIVIWVSVSQTENNRVMPTKGCNVNSGGRIWSWPNAVNEAILATPVTLALAPFKRKLTTSQCPFIVEGENGLHRLMSH